jgi:hypothetical protein
VWFDFARATLLDVAGFADDARSQRVALDRTKLDPLLRGALSALAPADNAPAPGSEKPSRD